MSYVRAKAAARDGKAMDFEGTFAAMKEMAKPMIEMYEEKSDAYTSTANLHDDGIIDPRDTRNVLARGLSIAMNAIGNESKFPEKFGVFRMWALSGASSILSDYMCRDCSIHSGASV